LMEADARYKFCDTDLIVVMFSSYTREDRWVEHKGGWFTPGNIYHSGNNNYPEHWKKEFTDERGYMIRDAALIHSTINFLENSPATGYYLLSNYFLTENDERNRTSTEINDVLLVYKDTLSKLPIPMNNYNTNCDWVRDYVIKDGHPSPIRYYEYLIELGFNLTDASKNYAEKATMALSKSRTVDEVVLAFPECQTHAKFFRKLMF
jgi:hypothetical protein